MAVFPRSHLPVPPLLTPWSRCGLLLLYFSLATCSPQLVTAYFAILQFTILRLYMVAPCSAPNARLGRLLTHALAGTLCTPWPAPYARLGRLLACLGRRLRRAVAIALCIHTLAGAGVSGPPSLCHTILVLCISYSRPQSSAVNVAGLSFPFMTVQIPICCILLFARALRLGNYAQGCGRVS